MVAAPTLIDPSGLPIAAKDIARIRARAGLSPGGWEGVQPYDAASVTSQDLSSWLPTIRSPDTELNIHRDRMVSRARDLVRNDGWANGVVDRILDNAIGSQFRLSSKPDYRALVRQCAALDETWAAEFGSAVEAEWRLYSEDVGRWCDASRTQTMTQMFSVALAQKLIDGDSIAIMEWLPEQKGFGAARYATAVNLVDSDRLSNPYDVPDEAHLRGGIEVNHFGAPHAYHIRRAHQNDFYLTVQSMIWDRIERETPWGRPIVVHDFDRRYRATQHRGTSIFAPILGTFKMLNRYDSAELQAAVLQTVMAFFIESPYDQDDFAEALSENSGDLKTYQGLRMGFHDHNPVMAGGVRIPKLFPGEKINTVTATRPSSHFDAFEHAVLRRMAASTGASAEQISQDWSKTNYSSARAALLESWKTLIRRRTDFAIGTASPIFAAWLEEAVEGPLKSLMPRRAPEFPEFRSAYARCRWIGPGRGWVDPVKERQGAVLGLDAGFSTLENEAAEQGHDWEEVLHQRAKEVGMMKNLDLNLPEWAGVADLSAAQVSAKPQPV